MAELRVRLKFDYPPPAGPESRQMWMLLNPEHLRTVTDLSELIRSRFYPLQRGALCLYVHDCLLPPAESARLVRDNDVIRVHWIGHDPEDDDHEGGSYKKRPWQRCEEDAEDRPAMTAKKRKCKPRREETPWPGKETQLVESSETSRRKAKKKKKVPEERVQEDFTEESPERNKGKKRSEDLIPLKAAKKIQRSNHEPSTKRVRTSSDSSSHQEPSEISIHPITIPLKTPSPMTLRLFAALSVEKKSEESDKNIAALPASKPSEMSLEPVVTSSGKKLSKKSHKPTKTPSVKKLKNKSNDEPPARSAEQIYSSDSEPKSSAKGNKPPNGLHKTRTIKKTKPNHDLPAKSAASGLSSSDQESSNIKRRPSKVTTKAKDSVTKTKHNASAQGARSSSDSSSSDQELSTTNKKPSKVPNKVDSVKKTNPNHDPLTHRARSSTDSSSSSSDQESSTTKKKPSKVPNNAGTHDPVNPKPDPPAKRVSSSTDSSASSSDQEPSTAREKSSEAARNPSNPVSGKAILSSDKRRPVSASDDGDTSIRRSLDAVTAPLLNGTSQKLHREIPSPGCDLGNCAVQESVTAPRTPWVTDGRENGGLQHEYEPNPPLYNHGRGRGRDFFPWRGQGSRGFRGRGEQGRGRGYNNRFFHSYGPPTLKKQHLEEEVTNTSVVIQNPPEIPKRDYNALPLLAAPPQVGKVIAFKILELNENYSPELSDYKEGVVCSYDPVTQQIEVELISELKRREPGKFDLVYELEDGKEEVEFVIVPECKIVEAWTSLISPRLVMETGAEDGVSPHPS